MIKRDLSQQIYVSKVVEEFLNNENNPIGKARTYFSIELAGDKNVSTSCLNLETLLTELLTYHKKSTLHAYPFPAVDNPKRIKPGAELNDKGEPYSVLECRYPLLEKHIGFLESGLPFKFKRISLR